MPGVSILSSKLLLRGRVFSVRREKAVQSGGLTVDREIVVHAGSAVMIARDARGRILLVRQFRLPSRRRLWELPAGRLEAGEAALRAAQRELVEETGYRARRWKRVLSFYPSPGYSSERMTVYLAEDLTAGEARPDPDETIAARWFAPAEIRRMIRAGRICDGKTVAGLLFLFFGDKDL